MDSPFLDDDTFFKSNSLAADGNLIKSGRTGKKKYMKGEINIDELAEKVVTGSLKANEAIKGLSKNKKDDLLRAMRKLKNRGE